MLMTLQHLKYAVKVADVGSMNEAAKQLLISQPSLSAAIRALEEETAIDIFKRTNKGVYVTAEGSAFLEHALLRNMIISSISMCVLMKKRSGLPYLRSIMLLR